MGIGSVGSSLQANQAAANKAEVKSDVQDVKELRQNFKNSIDDIGARIQAQTKEGKTTTNVREQTLPSEIQKDQGQQKVQQNQQGDQAGLMQQGKETAETTAAFAASLNDDEIKKKKKEKEAAESQAFKAALQNANNILNVLDGFTFPDEDDQAVLERFQKNMSQLNTLHKRDEESKTTLDKLEQSVEESKKHTETVKKMKGDAS